MPIAVGRCQDTSLVDWPETRVGAAYVGPPAVLVSDRPVPVMFTDSLNLTWNPVMSAKGRSRERLRMDMVSLFFPHSTRMSVTTGWMGSTVCPPLRVPVLLAKPVSPLYAAVTVCAVPLAARAESLMVALPPLSDTGEP